MLRQLWCSKEHTPLKIRLLLSKTYLIPTLLYGAEIFANCDSTCRNKLNVLFNNIARYIYNRRRTDSISEFSKSIFGLSFDNLLKLRTLTTLHKVINTREPDYIYRRIRFLRSARHNKIVIPRHSALLSERQFFVFSARLWNSLPQQIVRIDNAKLFKDSVRRFLNSS